MPGPDAASRSRALNEVGAGRRGCCLADRTGNGEIGSVRLSYERNKVLIVGLGCGSMVHFLKRLGPALKIDVVEIDPQIVDLANKYFQIRS